MPVPFARVALVALGLLALVPLPALAIGEKPSILLHLVPAGASPTCAAGVVADAASVVTAGSLWSGAGSGYYAFLLAARDNVAGLAGVQCGITYDGGAAGGKNDQAGIDILNWGHCGDMEFASPNPAWPAPGSGNLFAFMPEHGNCQTGELAVIAWFYVAAYAPGRLSLIPRPADGVAKVANCSSAEFGVPTERLGFVDFSASGVEGGCNPLLGDCVDQVAVETSTWSGVKALVSR